MAAPAKSVSSHKWRFYRAGGVDQVRIDTGADIVNLGKLDQKLWVALSCPVKGLEFDSRTLDLLDSDKDAHVRPPEILAAVSWLGEVLKNPDTLTKGQDGFELANIRTDTVAGKSILASAKHILAGLGKDKATSITIEDTTKTVEVFAKAKLNGDGIVPPTTIDDPDAKQVAEEIVGCLGGVPDRSGAPGYGQAQLDQFFGEAQAYSDWWKKAEGDAKNVLPLGTTTSDACSAFDAVRAKIDDYFGRCRLAAFDPRALATVNLAADAYASASGKEVSINADEIKHFPIALVEPNKPLPLNAGINPAWAAMVARFKSTVIVPLFKEKATLSAEEWETLSARFGAHKAWAAGKTGASVEKLGLDRVRKILAGKTKDVLQKAIADDAEVAPQVNAIASVEKLARLHRDFHKLLNNYVSFSDFYARRGAIFQAGTLYFDGRSLDLCFHVNDAGKHGTLAGMAKTYLAYVDCTRPGGLALTVACAFTAGDSDNIFVGRNGIFYDRKGADWNATITKIVSNPISIGQAFWSPYKKIMRWIEEQAAKRASAADDAASARLVAGAQAAGEAAKTGEAPKAKSGFDIGIVAALGVAVGGLATAASGFANGFMGLGVWMPVGILGLMLAISGPAMIIAWLKLRQRNLGPILDANGWAVNTLTKINIPLGRSLTDVARLPEGSERSMVDPYAPKKSPWPKIIVILLLLGATVWGLWHWGFLNKWLDNPTWLPKSQHVIDQETGGVATQPIKKG